MSRFTDSAYLRVMRSALSGAQSALPNCVFLTVPRLGVGILSDGSVLAPTTVTSDSIGKNVLDPRVNRIVNFPQNTWAITGAQEPAATNLCLQSSVMENAAWTASNITPSDNNATAPDGTATAALLTAGAGNGTIIQDLGVIASAAKTYQVWLKRKTGTGNIDLTLDNGATWTTKTITSSWARYSITQTLANPDCGIRIVTSGDAVWAWMNQTTALSYANSEIPTTSSTVTRSADALRWNNSGVINPIQDEGTMLAIVRAPWSDRPDASTNADIALNTSDGNNNSVILRCGDSGGSHARTFIYSNTGSTEGLISSAAGLVADQVHGLACAWKSGETRLFKDGTKEATGAPAALPLTLDTLEVGGWLSSGTRGGMDHLLIALFDRALTDAEAQALTATPSRFATL